MKLISVIVLSALLAFLAWGGDYYEYAILDKEKKEHVVLRVPKSSVSKYSGWGYNREGPVSISVWYPSLQDRVSYNMWISSSKEREAGEIKQSNNDRKLLISIGWSHITNPAETLNTSYRLPQCKLKRGKERYIEDGELGFFQRFILDTPGSARLYIIYYPITPIKGVYCMACVEAANCQLFGITDLGIPYRAFYEEGKMPQEAMNIHRAVGQYLDTKIVK